MTNDTATLVRQMREALTALYAMQYSYQMVTVYQYDSARIAYRDAISAADEWLSRQPKNLSPAPPISYEKSPTVGNPWGDC